MVIKVDNKSAIALTKNPVFHGQRSTFTRGFILYENVLKKNNTLSPIMAKAIATSDATRGFKNGALEMNASIHAIFVEKMEKVLYKIVTPEQASEELINDLTAKLKEMKGQE